MKVKWLENECASIVCDCGEEMVVDIYENLCRNTCRCGNKWLLIQSQEVVEVTKDKQGKVLLLGKKDK